jgi:CheY-like chemotaxis protein
MSQEERGKGAGGGLLLVENNEDDVLFFKRELARLRPGTPLEVVTNGAAALRTLSGDAPLPSLVLLDLKLPRTSGLEVLSWMKEQPRLKGIPTLVLTSSSEENSIRRAYALGALTCIVKPVEFARLRDVVAAILAYWVEPGEASLGLLNRHAAVVPLET